MLTKYFLSILIAGDFLPSSVSAVICLTSNSNNKLLKSKPHLNQKKNLFNLNNNLNSQIMQRNMLKLQNTNKNYFNDQINKLQYPYQQT